MTRITRREKKIPDGAEIAVAVAFGLPIATIPHLRAEELGELGSGAGRAGELGFVREMGQRLVQGHCAALQTWSDNTRTEKNQNGEISNGGCRTSWWIRTRIIVGLA